jgi:hypothetical protein
MMKRPTDAGRSAAVARYVFLMYDPEDFYDTADEQAVVDEMRLHEQFMEAVRAAGASVLGGEVIEAPDLDVALRLAKLCPAGNVEVRAVLELPDAG